MSTVRITSTGEFCPSAVTRSSRPLSRNSTSVLMPVSAVKASSTGWINAGWR
jgi:hypothetical protein